MQKQWTSLEGTLGQLSDNARKLTELSVGEFDAKQVEEIQAEQKTLIQKFQEYSDSFFGSDYVLPDEMTKKIHEIQKENDRFISNLVIRKSLIQNEVEELNKASGTMQEIKPRYGKTSIDYRQKVSCLG
ncbi:hypothetical protein SCG7109_AK_00040 [Chlamydiales bacterium SCGC AG-110-M15]|nr:hypothetical protein SCG7109_AK_00040 [Chlamydiales bacterium SCGC AG-110-M15]